MNLDHLRSFVEAVRHKSIAKASATLHLSHPAVSKQLRKLEDYYGVPLLHRTTAGVELTEAGALLYERAGAVLAELEAIRTDLARIGAPHRIVLGTLPSLAAHYLPQRLVDVAGVEVTVSQTTSEAVDLMKAGRVDALVVERLAAPIPASAWQAELFEEPFYAVLPKGHALAGETMVTLADLGSAPLVVHPPDCTIRQHLTHLLTERNIQPRIKVEAPFGEVLFGYVAAGAGIAVVPKLAAETLRHPELTALPLAETEARRTIVLIARNEAMGRVLLLHLQ